MTMVGSGRRSIQERGGRGTRMDDEGGGGGGKGGDDDTTVEDYRTMGYAVSRAAPLPSPRISGLENPYE